MKTSLALSWKALVSKIHPPLSLSPQDSQKLLRCLSASFQKRLDAEYPFRLEGTSHRTQNHLQSILGNPLFEAKPSRRHGSSPGSKRDGRISMHGLQFWIRQPLDAFQQGVSVGTATLETAKLCLDLQLKKYLAPSVVECAKNSDTAGTVSAVLSWLWSSGMEESGHYLKDRQFISRLVPFLVIEQRYDVIYSWFSRSQKQDVHKVDRMGQKSQMAQSALLLLELVRSENLYGAGLGASILHFTEYFRRNPIETVSFDQRLFQPSGYFLAHELAKPGKAAAIPKDILLSFIATSRDWMEDGRFATVVLQTHHPETPRPYLAVEYLQRLTPERLEFFKAHQRHSLIQTSLKAAELLLKGGHNANARWIMDFVQTTFAEDIGADVSSREPSTTKRNSLAQEETTHLRLLESLGVH